MDARVRVAVQECKRLAMAFHALGRESLAEPSAGCYAELCAALDRLAALSLHVAPDTDTGASASPTGLCGLRPEPQSVSALRAPIPGAWRPIETAPKDGRQIIGFRSEEWGGLPSVAVMVCSWEPLDNPVAKAWGIDGTWHRREINSGKGLLGGSFNPTHWMPLPAPPEAQAIVTREGQDPQGLGGEAIERGPGGMRPEQSEIAQPSLHIEPAAWAIYDSQGFYEARATEDEARRFCDRYNRRETDPLKPYTFYPLYTVPTTPTEGPAQPLTPEALYAIVPPSATEYMSQPPAMEFSTEWQIGWDSCRNGVRHRVYDLIAKSKSAGTLTDPEGAS